MYRKAFSILRYNGDFLFNYGAEASVAGEHALAITILEDSKKYIAFNNLFVFLGDSYSATNNFELAEMNYLHAIFIVPRAFIQNTSWYNYIRSGANSNLLETGRLILYNTRLKWNQS